MSILSVLLVAGCIYTADKHSHNIIPQEQNVVEGVMPQSVSNQEQTALMQSPFKDLEEWKAARHKYVARDPNVCNAQ